MTALNQQVFPTLRMPTGQSSWRIQSAGLHISVWTSDLFLFILAAFSSALTSRHLQHIAFSVWKQTHDMVGILSQVWNWLIVKAPLGKQLFSHIRLLFVDCKMLSRWHNPLQDKWQHYIQSLGSLAPVKLFLLFLGIVWLLQTELYRCLQFIFRKS